MGLKMGKTTDLRHNLKSQPTEHGILKEKFQQADTARYIAEMILELRNLSKSTALETLQGLLEIAYYEAFSAANRIQIPAGEDEFLHELGSDARRATNVA